MPGAFTLTRTGDLSAPLAVAFSLGGTATAADYTGLAGPLVFPAGAAALIVSLTPVADGLSEGAELVVLTLLPGAGYQLTAAAEAAVGIADADPPPALPAVGVVASDPSASERSPSPGEFTFRRSGDLTVPLTVGYTLSGTAAAADYQPLPGSVTFAAGARFATAVVVPVPDGLAEGPETVVLTLAAGPYVIGTAGAARVTIADADRPHVRVEAADADASEGSPSSGAFTFWRDGPLDRPLTVAYAVGGSATPGEDYQPLVGSVTIPAGREYAGVVVTAASDGRIEAAETVVVRVLENPARYATPPGMAVVTIANVDVPDPDAPPLPVVSVSAGGQPAEGGPYLARSPSAAPAISALR